MPFVIFRSTSRHLAKNIGFTLCDNLAMIFNSNELLTLGLFDLTLCGISTDEAEPLFDPSDFRLLIDFLDLVDFSGDFGSADLGEDGLGSAADFADLLDLRDNAVILFEGISAWMDLTLFGLHGKRYLIVLNFLELLELNLLFMFEFGWVATLFAGVLLIICFPSTLFGL